MRKEFQDKMVLLWCRDHLGRCAYNVICSLLSSVTCLNYNIAMTPLLKRHCIRFWNFLVVFIRPSAAVQQKATTPMQQGKQHYIVAAYCCVSTMLFEHTTISLHLQFTVLSFACYFDATASTSGLWKINCLINLVVSLSDFTWLGTVEVGLWNRNYCKSLYTFVHCRPVFKPGAYLSVVKLCIVVNFIIAPTPGLGSGQFCPFIMAKKLLSCHMF